MPLVDEAMLEKHYLVSRFFVELQRQLDCERSCVHSSGPRGRREWAG
jgi:hypothetical protein